MLVRVFYVSEIADDVSDLDVQVILGASQINNRRTDVTGMLVQSDGHFAQLLEGREEAVDAIMARIARDHRHRGLRVLLREPTTTRQFARWAMGLRRRDDVQETLTRLHEARRLMLALTQQPG